MGEVILRVADARYRYPGAGVDSVAGVSLDVRSGELVGIVGPNGSGKTTVLRLLAGVLHPTAGTITLLDRPVRAWRRRDLARSIGVVAQREEPAFPLTVEQAVLLGRYPHMSPLGAPTRDDRAAVEAALERCDVSQFRERWVSTLSGGEWQRVRIARALAQTPRVLMLDEATASLDVRHEMEVFELIAQLVRRDGLAGVVVTHHVNLAARFVDRIVVMNEGLAEVSGAPADVITRDVLERVFGWPVEVESWNGAPQFVALRKSEQDDRAS